MDPLDLRSRLREEGFPDDHVGVIVTTVDRWLDALPGDGVDEIDDLNYCLKYTPSWRRMDNPCVDRLEHNSQTSS